ncbi:MAG: 30S ribosomal protein S3 [Candidatus Margulisbacteria bacterium]|jgi:small subunit ribosomal protein S3|nr:30S ribosomal protein S3 [Candidatus Margulisiibacteriota bacterium]
MGQKVNPRGFRLGIIEGWDSFWYASDQEFGKLLAEDVRIRQFLKNTLYKAGISQIKISRKANQIEIDLYTAKPGLIIGKGGKEVAAIRDDLVSRFGKQVQLNVHEEKMAEANATLLAENIAGQLERRISTRRAMKQTVSRALRAGAKGVKVMVGGRLNGAEIARSEWYRMGRVPLHTLRANIQYGFAEAMTLYGKIGVKCWVYKGDVLPQAKAKSPDGARDKEKVTSGPRTS